MHEAIELSSPTSSADIEFSSPTPIAELMEAPVTVIAIVVEPSSHLPGTGQAIAVIEAGGKEDAYPSDSDGYDFISLSAPVPEVWKSQCPRTVVLCLCYMPTEAVE